MLSRHTNELYRRLERIADIGVVEIRKTELLLWYDQERVTVNIWRDLEDKWNEVDPGVSLLVGEAEGVWTFAYGKGMTCSEDSWFKTVHSRTKRIGTEDL